MKAWHCLALYGLLLTIPFAVADEGIRQEVVQFMPDQSSARINDRIRGRQVVDYQLTASEGQSLTVDFKPSNLAAYFNILPPGSEVALFIGSTRGHHFEAQLPVAGIYTIRVYLMRSAARRNETSRYQLDVTLENNRITKPASVPTPGSNGSPFDKRLEWQGIRFGVNCANSSSINLLRIAPEGLEIDNRVITRQIDGTVSGAEVADINEDGSPELYIYVKSAGSGSYGSLAAYSANRRKSLSEIYLPPLTDDEALSQGYMGHDQFEVVENVLVRRFPIYRDGDTNAKPTGGTRQLHYKLVGGEAGWILELDRMLEY